MVEVQIDERTILKSDQLIFIEWIRATSVLRDVWQKYGYKPSDEIFCHL